MATHDTSLFPAGKAPAVSDLAGGVSDEIFEGAGAAVWRATGGSVTLI